MPQPRRGSSAAATRCRRCGAGGRQGARPAGAEGTDARRPIRQAAAAIDRAGAARNGLALVEELVDGPEVTVVGFSAGGEFTALAVTDRLTAEPPAFGVALAHVWPSRCPARGAWPTAAAAVAALGIENGPSYTQLRVGPDGPKVIEVAARLGGGHDAELVEAVTGVDLNGLALDAALGGATDSPSGHSELRRRRGHTLPRRPAPASSSRSRCRRTSRASRIRVYREPGYVFAPLRRGADRAGAVLAVGATRGRRPWRVRTPRPTAYASSPRMPELSSTRRTDFLSFQPPAITEEEVEAVARDAALGLADDRPPHRRARGAHARLPRGEARAGGVVLHGGPAPLAGRARRRARATR